MKRGKKLMLLLLALVLVLGATWAVTLLNPENREEEETAVTVFSVDTESVTALSWDYSEPLSFEKRDGAWVYGKDDTFPLDSAYIDAALAALSGITAARTIEAVTDWDQYTLEVPICEITVTAGGTTHTLKIGGESAMGGQRYLSVGDGNAYLVDSAVLDPFSYGLYDLLSMETIPDMSSVRGLEVISDSRSYSIEYLENSGLAYSDDYVWFMDGQALDTELTAELLSCVTELTWVECVNYSASNPADYGLDTPAAVVTVQYDEGTFTLEIGAESGDYRYARIAGSDMVYTIDASAADTLIYTTSHELQPDEVLLMDWDAVTALEITLDGVTCQIERGTETVTDEEGIWLLNGEEVDISAITAGLDAMISTGYASGLTPEGTPEIRIVIHRDTESFPEVALEFYQYDSTACMTTLNGEATVLAQREAVTDLIGEVRFVVSG